MIHLRKTYKNFKFDVIKMNNKINEFTISYVSKTASDNEFNELIDKIQDFSKSTNK